MPGATVATTLNSQATPVPIAISVNMFSSGSAPRSSRARRTASRAHSTTGVASTSWTHVDAVGEIASWIAGNRSPPIPRTTTGMDRTDADPEPAGHVAPAPGSGPLSAVTMTGSSAIPQIGQEPGPGRRISGCIGHVYSTSSPPGAAPAAPDVPVGWWVW